MDSGGKQPLEITSSKRYEVQVDDSDDYSANQSKAELAKRLANAMFVDEICR